MSLHSSSTALNVLVIPLEMFKTMTPHHKSPWMRVKVHFLPNVLEKVLKIYRLGHFTQLSVGEVLLHYTTTEYSKTFVVAIGGNHFS